MGKEFTCLSCPPAAKSNSFGFMKIRTWLPVIFLICCSQLYGQDHKWSVEAYYPISVGQDFGSSNQGVIGTGLTYRFRDLGKVNLGASLDATWFATTITNDSDPIQEVDYRDFFLQPRLFGEVPLTPDEKLKLRFGLGWTINRSVGRLFLNSDGRLEGEEWNSGPNLNTGFTYDISTRWYLQGQYDLMFISGDSPNRTIGLLKVGAGFRF